MSRVLLVLMVLVVTACEAAPTVGALISELESMEEISVASVEPQLDEFGAPRLVDVTLDTGGHRVVLSNLDPDLPIREQRVVVASIDGLHPVCATEGGATVGSLDLRKDVRVIHLGIREIRDLPTVASALHVELDRRPRSIENAEEVEVEPGATVRCWILEVEAPGR